MNKELEVVPVEKGKEVKNLAEKLDMIGPKVMNRVPNRTELEGSHIVITSPKGNADVGSLNELSLHDQQLLDAEMERTKVTRFLLDEFHKIGGAKSE